MASLIRRQAFVGFVLLCCFTFFDIVKAINLDARFSVIKKGDKDSYFGYSVAEHQIVEFNNPKKVKQNVMIVGSPKKEVNLQGVLSGGAIYVCDALKADPDSCTMLTSGLNQKPSSSELVTDQWLGVTVVSQGKGKAVVACAHRYVKRNAALGRCFSFDQELTFDSPYIPCQGVPHDVFMTNFGLCQAGMAASIGQEDSLLMGAPGSVFWQGSVFLNNISTALGVSQTEIVSPYLWEATAEKQKTATGHYSYQGYSTAMGRFDGNRTLYYVTGAPRGENKGQVVFYRKIKAQLHYQSYQILRGPMPFSGYGSSLLAVDINNDGYDDLIVGAPYFFEKNVGGAIFIYLGAKNGINRATVPIQVKSRKMTSDECHQLGCEHARFGMALTKLGDINFDNYEDFAVGAPYEGDGAVYIFHGGKDASSSSTEPVQRIVSSDLPVADIKSFGQSLSGGMDLDGNGCPDLLVGAYESDVIALVRTRPIITIQPNITTFPNNIDLESKPDCNLRDALPSSKNFHCFTVTLCLSFTTKPASSMTTPSVMYHLEAEPRRLISRIELQGAKDVRKRTLEGSIKLTPGKENCATAVALVKSSFDDKLHPIELTYAFKLDNDKNKIKPFPQSAVQNINDFPILNTEGADLSQENAMAVEMEFVKECGSDNICISNLEFKSELLGLLKNKEADYYDLTIKQNNELRVRLAVINKGEAAYLTRIYVQKPPMLTYNGLMDTKFPVQCTVLDDTLIMCDKIGNPLRNNSAANFTLRMKVPLDMESDELYNITAWVNTSSTEKNTAGDNKVMEFKVINEFEIVFDTNVSPDNAILCQGEPRGASSMKNEASIGASVKHNYIVRNIGPGIATESLISIFWPYEVAGPREEGKYLLYLMRPPMIIGPVVKCNDDEIVKYINPLRIEQIQADGTSDDEAVEVNLRPITTANSTDNSRQKRDTAARSKRASGSVVELSCKKGTARCFEYRCELGKLEPKVNYVKITMESRLWESTLITDYRKASDVQIISYGKLTVPKKKNPIVLEKRAITRAVPDYKESTGQTLPWWVIFVAVMVGVILLLVLIFILYKCGFFRRKRPEDMQMYKAEKKQQAMLNDNDNNDDY